MATQPSETLTVTVTVLVGDNPPFTDTNVVAIPPDYDPTDVAQFVGFHVERTAGQLLRDNGYPRPRFRALLINAARMWLVEKLANSLPTNGDKGVVRAALLAIIMKDDQDAIDEADLPPED